MIVEDPIQEIKFVPVTELLDNTICLRLQSVDMQYHYIEVNTAFARNLAEALIKRCDELENE